MYIYMYLSVCGLCYAVLQDLGFSPDFDLYEVLGPSMRTYRKRVGTHTILRKQDFEKAKKLT
jgi:hypothetical protein